MSLHIILGFDSAKSSAEPTIVYAGRSGAAARAAMDKSTAATFGLLANPVLLRKNNPRASANRAALDPASLQAAAEAEAAAALEAEGKAEQLRAAALAKARAIATAQGVAAAAVDVVLDAIAKVAAGLAEEQPESNQQPEPSSQTTEAPVPEAAPEEIPIAPPVEPAPLAESPAPESSEADDSENHFAPPPRRKRST